MYEVPYQTDEMLGQWANYVTRLTELLAENRPADALELFMRLAGSPDEVIAEARQSPFWASGVALAPTLAYDAACLGDGRVPVGKLAKLTQPTLVATGGTIDPQMSGLQPGFFDAAADAMAADPQVLGSALRRFFNG